MKQKILEYFKDLTFNEEEHIYFVKGEKIKISVSGLIKRFEKEVDFVKKAKEKDENNKLIKEIVRDVDFGFLAKGAGEDLKLPTKKTKEVWDTKAELACAKGTKVHLFGEVYPFNRNLKPQNKFEEAIVKFWNDIPDHIIPVIMELQMYHKEYMFAGTADILLYDTKSETYIIGDYKTNENLFRNFLGKTLKDVFSNLLNTSFNKYQLQLSFYQILFEQLGLKVSDRKLVWLLPTGEYEMYDTQDYTKELKEHLKYNPI